MRRTAPQPENRIACVLLTILTAGVFRFFSVPQGYVRIITAFGKLVAIAEPGLGSCLSLFGLYQKPGTLVPTMEQVRTYKGEDVITRDGVGCSLDLVVFFRVDDPMKAVFEVEDYELAIMSLVQATLRNECGHLPARELLSSREKLASRLREILVTDTSPWGISARLVEITGIGMAEGNERKGESR
jgi:regulator of protease activity HflC (stomatin/prohibitin superfamily)